MEAAVITLTNVHNYGNELQNYAVMQVLKQWEDIDCITLTVRDREDPLKRMARFFMYLIHRATKYRFTSRERYWRYEYKRNASFACFHKRYIPSKAIDGLGDIPKMDCYILGSDQVWNPEWYDQEELRKDLFLLTFAQPEQKVCFSPSFGISSLPDRWKPWFSEHLQRFPVITVREEAGAAIVKELTGKDAIILIDPTLMLDKDEWRKISKAPQHVDHPETYILTYFLGDKTEGSKADIRYYAQMLDAKVYDLLDIDQPMLYAADPSAFIYLIDHAKMVMTDSFHGSVFSFLFGKPFFIYAREGTGESMLSRMDTFIDKFDLKRKFIKCGERKKIDEVLEADYSIGYSRLSDERKKVIAYLSQSLSLGKSF